MTHYTQPIFPFSNKTFNISFTYQRLLTVSPHSVSLLYVCILFLALYSIPGFSANLSETEKLEALKNQIQQLQTELKTDNKEKDEAVYRLQQVEKQVAKASQKLRKTRQDFNASQEKLASLHSEEKLLHNQLTKNREYLLSQVRAAYSIGKQEYVKLLLNQEDPSAVARMVTYYQYFNQARTDKLEQIDKRLVRLKSVKHDIREQSNQLDKLKQEAFEEREILESRKQDRRKVVASLNSALTEKNHRLKKLLRDEQHLKKLLQKIESQLNDVQLDLAPPKKFKQLKGKLHWPTSGVIGARFGSLRKNSGNLKWKGVVIDTKPGNTIKSVAYGRVVFADWLRGFGMLIIIDHGDGYMSLYGHNEQLHKKLGDWVQPNEVIATSGDSGGLLTTSLYFEIRHKGKPQDPVKWCKSLPERS